MIQKIPISPEKIRNNAFLMAKKLYNEGFRPTVMYSAMRGGSYTGNPMSEYFYYMEEQRRKKLSPEEQKEEESKEILPIFGTVIAKSYIGIGEKREVEILGWLPDLSTITEHDRILIAEDIVDTGDTLFELVEEIEQKTPLRREPHSVKPIAERQIVVVAHDFKIKTYEPTKFVPDLWAQKWTITSEEDNKKWYHYMTHEMCGLTEDEIRAYYGDVL